MKYFEISHILRVENARTDVLSRLVTTLCSLLDRTFIEYLKQSNIDKIKEVLQINDELSWMDLIIQFLTDETLPADPLKAK